MCPQVVQVALVIDYMRVQGTSEGAIASEDVIAARGTVSMFLKGLSQRQGAMDLHPLFSLVEANNLIHFKYAPRTSECKRFQTVLQNLHVALLCCEGMMY